MRYRFLGLILAWVAVFPFSPVILAQTAKGSGAAKTRTAATPDLSGVWMKVGRFGFTKEEPPMQPWAEAKYKAAREGEKDPEQKGRDDLDPSISCFPPGPTRIFLVPRPFEIMQIPGRVLLHFEWDHWVRHIWTDGREHPQAKDLDPTYMGHSIGKWDGDPLVVDTIGLNDKTWLDGLGHPHSDALHLVERIRRVDHATLQIDLTFDDPKAYTKPWTGEQVFKLRPGWDIAEQIICEDRLLDRVIPYLHDGKSR